MTLTEVVLAVIRLRGDVGTELMRAAGEDRTANVVVTEVYLDKEGRIVLR